MGHGLKFLQMKRFNKDHILDLISDPESEKNIEGTEYQVNPTKGCKIRVDQWPRKKRILNTATCTKVLTTGETTLP